MHQPSESLTNLDHFGVPRLDPGWIYAVKSGSFIKVGKTTDPQRRLLGEARTWSPDHLDIIGVKPFWNISRLEYSLHSALAEHWHRGEWHKFNEVYWMNFFIEAFQEFNDGIEYRDRNSVDFAYWMQGTNYAEIVDMQCESQLSLRAWQQCRARPTLGAK
jgi:hypothetical protein